MAVPGGQVVEGGPWIVHKVELLAGRIEQAGVPGPGEAAIAAVAFGRLQVGEAVARQPLLPPAGLVGCQLVDWSIGLLVG